MRVRLSLASLLALVAVLAVACGGGGGGGGGGGEVPAGASVAPASAAVFASISTDFSSDQWSKAQALAAKFPGTPQLLSQLTQQLSKQHVDFNADVKPALGPEVDVVVLDLKQSGNDTVVLTQPRDKAKLDALLAKGSNPPARAEIDGWTVLADDQAKIERFRTARSSGALADNAAFKTQMGKLPSDTLVRVFVAGSPVQQAVDTTLSRRGASPGATGGFGSLTALAVAATAADNGLRFDGSIDASLKSPPEEYKAELPSELPSGAYVFLSFNGLDKQLGQVLGAVEDAQPNLKTQLSQVEAVLGLSLQNDVFPLFSGEGGVAVYPSTGALPTIELALHVPDEAKARTIADRIGAIARVAGGTVQDVDVSGIQAHELKIPNQSFSIFYAVFDGKLVITNTRDGIAGFRSSGPRLKDDPLYKEAADAASLPDKTLGFFYADLRDALPYALDLAESRGSTIPANVRQNLRPLDAAVFYGTKDGSGYGLGGFLTLR